MRTVFFMCIPSMEWLGVEYRMLVVFVEDSKSTRSKARHEEGRAKAGNAEDHLDQFVDFLKYEIVERPRSAGIRRRWDPIASKAEKAHLCALAQHCIGIAKTFKRVEPANCGVERS